MAVEGISKEESSLTVWKLFFNVTEQLCWFLILAGIKKYINLERGQEEVNHRLDLPWSIPTCEIYVNISNKMQEEERAVVDTVAN